MLERGRREEEEQWGQQVGQGPAGNWKCGGFGEVRMEPRHRLGFPLHLTTLSWANQAWRNVQLGARAGSCTLSLAQPLLSSYNPLATATKLITLSLSLFNQFQENFLWACAFITNPNLHSVQNRCIYIPLLGTQPWKLFLQESAPLHSLNGISDRVTYSDSNQTSCHYKIRTAKCNRELIGLVLVKSPPLIRAPHSPSVHHSLIILAVA